jgi:hypothetical protein
MQSLPALPPSLRMDQLVEVTASGSKSNQAAMPAMM